MHTDQNLVLTPPGSLDPSIAIAASRAGAVGVLNLAHLREETLVPIAMEAIERMIRAARGRCGVRLDAGAPSFMAKLSARLPREVGVVVLFPGGRESTGTDGREKGLNSTASGGLAQAIAELRAEGRTILLEVTSLELGRLGRELGVDGLVATGHESNGWVSDDPALILVQELAADLDLPVWGRGGIGPDSVAAFVAAGATGVVLDDQVALARESSLPAHVKAKLAALEGEQTVTLPADPGSLPQFRAYAQPGSAVLKELTEAAGRLGAEEWRQLVERRVGWGDPGEQVWPLGQDAALAAPLAERYRTVSGILAALVDAAASELGADAAAPVRRAPKPSQVAIVGMSAILPRARTLQQYWENLLNKVYAITEVPEDRWPTDLYFDPDRNAKDKVYSKWGAFIDDVAFDPTEFGMPPTSLPSIDPMHFLALLAAREAVADAGYAERPFDRSRTSVVLGASGGVGEHGAAYVLRSSLPLLFGDAAPEIVDLAGKMLPEWTEDSFAGILLNVASGRITNRLDLGGTNFIVDAACASSLTAVHAGVKELETDACDMVIVGGVDTVQNPFGYLCFSKTQALSPTGEPRVFDATADGIVLGEGVVMLVLKRLADAERDGDRIYAVIQGVGASSDGKGLGLTAPRPGGQKLALDRAYGKAGISPATVGLFEAHGTGTVVGDRTEARSLSEFLEESGAAQQSVAVGSVKSMIGHTKATAGVAGLAKLALSLYHRVLPPTLGVTQPNPNARFGESPLYVNSETRPWIHRLEDHPRRAGVSAFGFGGTNFHAVVEEYTGDYLPREPVFQHWPSELLLWSARSREALLAELASLERALEEGARPELGDLAYTLHAEYRRRAGPTQAVGSAYCTLAIVVGSADDLREKLAWARQGLTAGSAPARLVDPRGIYFAAEPLGGKVAFLFPGQGSQYPNMVRDLALAFPEVRETFERADRVLAEQFPQPLSGYVFPPPAFSREEEGAQEAALTQTNVAQPALGAASMGVFHLLRALGLAPDMVAGHSYGEYVALCAAGGMDEEDLLIVSEARGRAIIEAAKDDLGTMAAVRAEEEAVAPVVDAIEGVWLANMNAPKQTVISGTWEGIAEATERLNERGIGARPIAVSCAFHSPLVAPAQQRLAEALPRAKLTSPTVEVFSNTTAGPYPEEPQAIRELLTNHLVRPVRFLTEVEAMYAAGARVFVEVGPRSVLTSLAGQTLGEHPHVAVALDQPGRPGLTQLQHALGQIAAFGAPLNLDRLFQGRTARLLDLSRLVQETAEKPLSPTTWLVNGARARPIGDPGGLLYHPLKLAPVTEDVGRTLESGPMAWDDGQGRAGAASAPASHPLRSDGGSGLGPEPRRDDRGSVPGSGVEFPRFDPGQAARRPARESRPVVGGVGVEAGGTAAVQSETTRPPAGGGDGSDQVMVEFQNLMSRFLEAQRGIMLSYLQGAPSVERLARDGLVPGPALDYDRGATTTRSSDIPREVPPPVREPVPAPDLSPMATPAPVYDRGPAVPPAPSARTAPAPSAGTAPAPSAGTAPALAAAAAEDGRLDRGALTAQLLAIVSERTGYPSEMLDLDLDLEADLGIDSIKRVEILGQLRQALSDMGWDEKHLEPERVAGLKTLQAVIDEVVAASGGDVALSTEPVEEGLEATGHLSEADSEGGTPAVDEFILRSTFRAVDRSLTTLPAGLATGTVVVITDDGRGVAQALGARLQEQGTQVAVLQHFTSPSPGSRDGAGMMGRRDSTTASGDLIGGDGGPDRFVVDLRSEEDITRTLARIRETRGPVAGLVHLLPLQAAAPFEAMDLADWRERLALEARSLFLLAKAVGDDLHASALDGGAVLLAASGMGGAFAADLDAATAGFFPGQGAFTGFLKTLAKEWPEVRVKAVDLDLGEEAAPFGRESAGTIGRESAGTIADHLLGECLAADGTVEVGYPAGRRVVLAPVSAPYRGDARVEIGDDWVVLVTGGARGITADVAQELAERYRPTLVLVGRSPLPAAEEDPDTAGLTEPGELKAALIRRMQEQGQAVVIAHVERGYDRLLKEREMRANMAAMVRAGARVHYHSVDVRDEAAFGALIDGIYETFGRLDGVIHGAGIVEDKLVRDKPVESFDRVLGTKVDSAFILSQVLRPESLRFLVFFSSVAGRFGNRGQADYGAANEVLDKLAVALDRRWPGRVVAIIWGAWKKRGMVSPELQRRFAERGIRLVPPEAGRRWLVDEIRFGASGEAEVLISGGLGEDWAEDGGTAEAATAIGSATAGDDGRRPAGLTAGGALPLLQGAGGVSTDGAGDGIELDRTLDLSRDLFLRDHVLDGKPVLPAAMAMELMAEVVQQGWPDLHVVGVQDLYVLHGVILSESTKQIRVLARRQAEEGKAAQAPATEGVGGSRSGIEAVRVDVEIVDPDKPNHRYYRATVELADALPEPPVDALPGANGLQPFPMSVEDAYDQWLFHGPIFRAITDIEGVSDRRIVANCQPSTPQACLEEGLGDEWLIDPVVFDCGLQLSILWARANLDATTLISRLGAYRRYGPLSESPIRCDLRILAKPDGSILPANIAFIGRGGRLLGLAEGVEFSYSKRLNRLTGRLAGSWRDV